METVYLKTLRRAGRAPAWLWRKWPTTFLAAVAGTILVALALAGCGGGSSGSGVAATGSTTSTASTAPAAGDASSVNTSQAEKFSQCMRSHGVPNFPDLTGGKPLRVGQGTGLNPNSPQFQAAQKACRSLAPSQNVSPGQSAQLQAQALKFAQCMRSHGVPKFPDPASSGGGTVQFKAPSGGLDTNSPQFKSAQQACRSLAPGGRTGGG